MRGGKPGKAWIVFVLVAVGAVQLRAAEAPWRFTARFASGFSGWMSYPLAQDTGYDPGLYTERSGGAVVLVREVRAHGQQRLAMGVIRPLEFHAGPQTRIRMSYRLRLTAPLTNWSLVLAGRDGHRYTVGLPAGSGQHTVEISGAALHLPAAGMDIQAIVVEGWLKHPARASLNRFELGTFDLRAQRPPAVTILAPALEGAPGSERRVAATVIDRGGALNLTLAPSPEPVRVELADPGSHRMERVLPASPSAPVHASIGLGAQAAPGLWTADVTSGAAHTRFSFLVLGQTPAHPRLLLSQARLRQLQDAPDFAAFRAELHRQAQVQAARLTFDDGAGDNIALMPVGHGLGPSYDGELVPYFALMDGYANAIADNALDYRLNHSHAGLEIARRGLLTVAGWRTWTPPRFSRHGMHTYYEVGLFAQRVAFAYDLIASELTPAERAGVSTAFRRKIIRPTVDEYFLDDRMPLAASNWMANSLGGALAATVAIAGDTPDWRRQDGVALAELTSAYEQNLAGLFPGDGSEAEPAGYENFAMQGIAWGMAALQALGIRPAGADAMLNGFWWPDYAMVRPGLVLDTGDFDGELKALSGFAWGAEHGGIPALRAFYDRAGTPLALPASTPLQDTGRRLEDMPGLLDLVCCTHPAAAFAPPPLARIFPRRGSAVLRSGWGDRATVVSIRVGAWFNHEHHDQGSFQVAARGASLIADAGYADYYRDPNYPTYFTQASGHNTVVLDGDPFSQGEYQGRFWKALSNHPRFTDHLFAPGLDYLSANLAPAYQGRLSRYQRQYLFLAPDVLLVRDRLRAPAAHSFSWLLHAAPGLNPELRRNRATLRASAASAVVTAVDPQAMWTTRQTPIAINAFRDLDRGVIAKREEVVWTKAAATSADFLVALQVGQPAAQLTAVHASNAEGFAAPDGEWSAMFRTGRGVLWSGGRSTDGSLLVQRGATWMATGATWVRDGGRLRLVSTRAVDVSWQQSGGSSSFDLHSGRSFDLRIPLPAAPATVEVDGHPTAFTYKNGSVVLANIPRGEHRVWFSGRQLP